MGNSAGRQIEEKAAMFIDKSDEKLCDECGEPMKLIGDYGISGQAFKCVLCGFYVEQIDLRDTTLSQN